MTTDFHEFISHLGAEYSEHLISASDLPSIEEYLKVSIGPQLRTYLLDYGYLAYRSAELYGIVSTKWLYSDMVRITMWLRKHTCKVDDQVAVENQGDGDYYLVDSRDNVYRFLLDTNELIPQGVKLFEYIIVRFESLKALAELWKNNRQD